MTPAESLISPTINLIAVPDGYDVFFTEDGGGGGTYVTAEY